MQMYTLHVGPDLVANLRSDDEMTEAQAIEWIEVHTGYRYDPVAMYKLRWDESPQVNQRTIARLPGLRVGIMSDFELVNLDRESRRDSKKPPHKPGEPWEYQAFMGRAQAAQRIEKKDKGSSS